MGVRVAIISLIVTSLLTVIGFVVTATTSNKPTGGGSTSVSPSPISDTGDETSPEDNGPASPSPEDTTIGPDGLTTAERALRDSLNKNQWQRESCVRTTVPDAKAALECTVSVPDAFGVEWASDVTIMEYPSKDALRSAFRKHVGNLPAGNCDTQWDVRGHWTDRTSSKPIGDMACFTDANTGMSYVTRTFYDRPVAFEVYDADTQTLINWVNALDPVFE